MSEESVQPQEATTECATCGHVPGPYEDCGICHGNGQVQTRAFTLTEERRKSDNDPDRYGRTGAVGPKIANLPGSGGLGGGFG